MSLLQFSGLFVVWLLCTLFIATLTWFEFRRVRFNFNVFFSLLFLLTFFFGFPLTSVLVFRFDVGAAPSAVYHEPRGNQSHVGDPDGHRAGKRRHLLHAQRLFAVPA